MNENVLPITVTKYATRHWAVWLGGELIAVTLYKKGAARVAELLRETSPELKASHHPTSPEIESAPASGALS